MYTQKTTYAGQVVLSALILLLSAVCVLPFVIIISSSMTKEIDLLTTGYNILPKRVDFASYRYLFQRMDVIANGYRVSGIVTIVGTLCSLAVNAMMAYPLSLKRLKYRNYVSGYVVVTMLFNGGMVPWYIVCVRYLHLYNNIVALILPSLVSGFNIFLMRNYFSTIPEEMHESAKMDGAGEMKILVSIILPLSIPVFASVGLFVALAYWNDWWLGLMLVDKVELQPLQLLLRSIVSNVDFLASSRVIMGGRDNLIPREGVKMAATIVTIGPVVFLYPLLQKYFVKGLMMGAVKG